MGVKLLFALFMMSLVMVTTTFANENENKEEISHVIQEQDIPYENVKNDDDVNDEDEEDLGEKVEEDEELIDREITKTRMMSIARDPDKGSYIRHYGGKCITVDVNSDQLYLHHVCQDRFEWMGNKLRHVESGRCIHQRADNFLVLYYCSHGLRLRRLGSHQNLQTIDGKLCIHPLNGGTNPPDGRNIVMHPTCNLQRLRFTFHNVPNDFSSRKEKVITIKHSGGKCLSLGSDGKIHLTTTCSDFVLDDKNNLKHFESGKCIAPDGHTYLTAYSICNQNTKFKLINGGYLKHTQSGKCVHPYGGSANPSEGTKTVVHQVCSGNHIKFSLHKQRSVHLYWLKRIREVRHNRCVTIVNNRLQLSTTDCWKSFVWQGSSSLMHFPSMKCVKPTCNSAYCSLALSSDCDRQSWYENHNGAIKNRWNGRCFNVDGGNFIFLSQSCTRQFRMEALGYSEDVGRHIDPKIYKIVHSGGKCVSTNNTNKLTLKSKCEDLYQLDKNGHLIDLYTGKKVGCTGEACSFNGNSPNRFFITSKKELKLVTESKCLIPYGGSTSPNENTKLVIHQNCGYGAVYFKFNPVEALVKYVFYQKTSSLCFAVDKNDRLYLSKHCSTNFAMTRSGSLVHVDSGRCVAPKCGSYGCHLYVRHKCDSYTRFKIFSNGLLKNIATGTCLHPSGGQERPNDGTPMVVHGCDFRAALGYGMRHDGYIEGLTLRQTLAWAPKVYFHKNEKYFPSSVDYFLQHVRIEPWQSQPSVLTGSNFPKITVGKWLETKQRLSTPTNILSFFHGQRPDQHSVPIYNLIKVSGRITTLRYFLFYPYNKGKNMCIPTSLINCVCSWFGNHVGDWEHVKFTLKDGKPYKVEMSSHNFAMHFTYWNRNSMVQTGGLKLGDLQVTPDGNVATFIAEDSHGQYPGPIKYHYKTFAGIFPAIDYCSSNGLSFVSTNNVKAMVRREHRPYTGTESWRNFKGRWGNVGRHFSSGQNCYGGTLNLLVKKVKIPKFCRLNEGPTLSD